ncbi:Non-ribosomal peptide sythetase [Lactococcus lactis subsp. lactis NCDO 2118]|uniref:Non-ribosomal peptide sythetase n=1 Tax=Lactococcus lactis subsp. lactis NCDO 2118 TaxID=1117941 RepID=A0ABC8A6N5_LACLL|nr:non-ribosomal peptide synthetase [Lactococcus lactis]AII12671.1 Non-ribosomal peptide sythetase [Lactococcus lactis subsp. lactis NCDO 2118]
MITEKIQKFNNLVEAFENQARIQPDKIALKFDEVELSYYELNGYANGVANRLIELGVRVEDKIPLLVERSEKVIIGMLGILKAGAAFVPLASDLPKERIDYIIGQTGSSVCVNDDFMNYELQFVEDNVDIKLEANNLAYIIFTSGTTGQPKGVMVEHQNIMNTVRAHVDFLDLSKGDKKYLQYANYVFDASMIEIFPTLLYGNCLVIVPEEIRLSLEALANFIEENSIDYAFIPPVLLDTEIILPLKVLLVGGEKTNENIVRAYRSKGIELVNAYGPTEVAVSCTLYKFAFDDLATRLGYMQPNMVGYVVNEEMKLVQDGEIGELLVSGVQIARGYVNAPELTNEKFLDNPFGSGRIYKTGDLVKKLPDGAFEYHGRNDSQVKVRGQRVELGEIESALTSIKDISQAYAITYKNSVVVYYTSKNNEHEVAVLRDNLKKLLPEYMVPACFIYVPTFPMTINGKFDRKNLPDPAINDGRANTGYVAPQTDRQAQIQAIVEEVVGFNRISIDTNIFEIGGNSISAIQIANKVGIAVSDVYVNKTIRQLAAIVSSGEKIQKMNFAKEEDQGLSYAQESMWFIQELNNKTAAYNNVISITLSEEANVTLVEAALKNIVQRHEVLRTTIKDNFQHIIDGELEVTHEAIDTEEFGKRTFDLSTELPIRANLFNNQLILSVHHIAFDGWSLDVLLSELVDYYNGKKLKDLPIQYKDFATWQRENHGESYFAESLDYWEKEFKDFEQLDLPTDFVRPTQFDYSGDEITFKVSSRIYKKLEKLARKNGTTMYTVFLAAFYILLSSYSNQEDITIGSPLANRQFLGCEELIGYFVNTLPVRAKLGRDQSFRDLVTQTHEKMSSVQEYQETPFEKIVNVLKLNRDTSKNPLFQVVFTLQEFGTLDSKGLFEDVISDVNTHSSLFDLSLNIFGRSAQFTYSRSLFEANTIKGFIKTFKLILEQVSQDEEIKLKDIVLTREQSDFEQKQLKYTNLVESFEAQVKKSPNQIALSYEEQSLSYNELNQRVNAFAYALVHEFNVKKGDIIPLLLPRSENVIISILAVMKAGAAYVPLSLEYPKDRIDYILGMVNAPFVIDEGFLARVSSENRENLNLEISGTDLAYLIFTSGSTGKPKGVMIEHAGVVNMAQAHADMLGLTEGGHTYLQYANYIFDASILEIFPTLLFGNRLAVVPEKIRLDLKKLSYFIEENQSDYAFIPPILLDTKTILPVKTLLVGGDKTAIEVVNTYLEKGVAMYNAYGPTESTVSATIHKYEEGDKADVIGRGQLNTPVYVLDKFGRDVPQNGIGELYVGGPQLSRGYIKQEELTRERFIDSRKGRLYATGDLAKIQKDGNLKYLGRNDFQVKIRGNRVELGEIEKVLVSHPKINQVLVLAKDNSLIAYYVANHSLNTQELSQYLSKSLPPYMIPSYFVSLKKLPMHINGKIDLSALPKPTISFNKEIVKIETELEHKIQLAFATILSQNPDQISAAANFFQIGGDSIKAILITSALKKQGIVANVRQIMEYPTIQQLAEEIERNSVDTKIDNSVKDGEVFKLPIQKWFLDKQFENPNHFNQAYLLELEKQYDEKFLKLALLKLIEHHDALRVRIDKENNELIQDKIDNYQLEKRVILDTIDISQDANWKDSLESLEKSSQKNFDIYQGRLINLQQIIGPSETYLLISIHHLVIDEVSWHILLEDLFSLLKDLQEGKEVELPEKTSSASSWAEALTNHSKHFAFDREKSYWKKLAEETNELLPKDFEVQTSYLKNNKKVVFSLPVDETEAITKTAHKAYNTQINDLLLSSLALSLKRQFGTRRMLINLEGHGREQFDRHYNVERTIGWFTSLYPFCLKVGTENLEKLIIETKENLRAIPSKGLFYGLIKDELGAQASALIPELSFNFIGDISDSRQTNYHIVKELSNSVVDPSNEKLAIIEINSYILHGQLFFEIDYSNNAFETETMTNFSQGFMTALNDISQHCQSVKETIKTPFDFGSQKLTNKDLKNIYKKVDNVEKIKPLSPMQLGIFYDYLKEPSSSHYTEQITASIDGLIKLEDIENAFRQLIHHHDVLKSVFLFDGLSEPKQISSSTSNPSMQYHDLSTLSEKECRIKKLEIIKYEQMKGFDLENNLGIRLLVLKETEHRTSLVFTFHHILMDGWSYALFLEKFFAYFKDSTQKITSGFDYFDYINQLTMIDKEASLDYWKNYLDSYEGEVKVQSFERPLSLSNEKQMKYLNYSIPSIFMDKLQTFSHKNSVTLNDICSALWGIALQKLNQTDDVVFGTILSGRNIDNFDASNILGLCIQQIPLRVQNKRNHQSMLDLVVKVKEDIEKAQNHLNCNLIEILSSSSIAQLSHKILFNNYPFSSQNLVDSNLPFQLDNLKAEEIVEYDFGISFVPGEGRLDLEFNFNSQKYSDKDIEKVFNIFAQLVEIFVENPNADVERISILNGIEREKVESYSGIKKITRSKGSLLQRFREAVILHADEVAVYAGREKLTYRELDELSNGIASNLKDLGVKERDHVVLYLEADKFLLPSIFGVLKAGATFVPLDPEATEARNIQLLANEQESIVLTNTEYPAGLDHLTQVVNVEETKALEKLEYNIETDAPAYMIYTSGTTGTPKGVVISKDALLNYIDGIIKKLGQESLKNSILTSKYSFDLGYTALFTPLFNGGNITLATKDSYVSSTKLTKLIQEHQVTYLKMTPSLFSILRTEDFAELDSLKVILLGGESIQANDLLDFRAVNPRVEFWNHYGPTETTIGCISGKVDWGKLEIGTTYNILGQPNENMGIYVLDKQRKMLPFGSVGELYITGVGLSDGYFSDEKLTSEKFIPNPFENSQILYATGDLVRLMENGDLVFCGRKDAQIKHLGYRINLSEIESSIAKEASVIETSVIQMANSKLGAAVILEDGADLESVKSHLKEILPSYMYPNYFIRLNKFPMTNNGKRDLKELQQLILDCCLKTEAKADAKTDTERRLHKIWSNLLKIKTISKYSNFYELGGNSLQALRLLSVIHSDFKIDISLSEVVNAGTICALAQLIDGSDRQYALTIKKAESAAYYPVSSQQKQMYALSVREPNSTAYNVPIVLKLKAGINLDVPQLKRALHTVVSKHEALRTLIFTDGSSIKQNILEKFSIPFEIRDISYPLEKTILSTFVKPFDLTKEIPIRAYVIYTASETYLVFDSHHIAMDGFSIEVFLKDLMAAYHLEVIDEEIYQYKDYSEFQMSSDFKKQEELNEAYWGEKLIKKLPVLDLSNHRFNLGDEYGGFEGETLHFSIKKSLSNKLVELCKSNHYTLNSYLLSLFAVVLSRFSGQKEVMIGGVEAGRNYAEFSHTVGMFVNTLPHRLSIEENLSFYKFLQTTQMEIMQDIEHSNFPFERMVQLAKGNVLAGQNPLFDVSFVYSESKEFTNSEFEIFAPYYEISKFDLTLLVNRAQDSFNCIFEFKKGKISKEIIQTLKKMFENALSFSMENLDTKIQSMKVMNAEDEQKLLKASIGAIDKSLQSSSVLNDFENYARTNPNRICLEEKGKKLSYKEVNEQANALANYLTARISMEQSIVPVYMKRSTDLIVSILALWKSGKAYLPLDSSYPVQRIQQVLKEIDATIILSQSSIANHLNQASAGLVSVDSLHLLPTENGPKDHNINKAAYVIFTSGTTGRPKGIEVGHTALANYIHWARKQYILDGKGDFALFTSISFDLTVTSLFVPLSSGHKLVIYENEDSLSLLEEVIKEDTADVIKLTPAHLSLIAQSDLSLNRTHTLILGGENLNLDLTREIQQKYPHIRLFNEYGPTEATVGCMIHQYQLSDKGLNVSIGLPIDNAEVFVLDRNMKLLPTGVVGELYIGGTCLSNGYLNDSSLNKEKFVVNPFKQGEYLYCTGDLCKWTANMKLDCLGRKDEQVKVNGYRIELGDIEQKILTYPSVKQAVVFVESEKEAHPKLYAALVSEESQFEIENLRTFLTEQLPYYMVPTRIANVEVIPLTANGKKNLRLLTTLVKERDKQKVVEEIKTEKEKVLVKIIQETLNVGNLNRMSNYYELGGDSIQAILISSKLKNEGLKLKTMDILQNPIVKNMALLIENEEKTKQKSIPYGKEFGLTPIQQWLFDQKLSNINHYNQSMLIKFESVITSEKLEEAFWQLSQTYPVLQTQFIPTGQGFLQSLLKVSREDIENRVFEHEVPQGSYYQEYINQTNEYTQASLNIYSGDLWRVHLFNTQEGQYCLFVIHHLVVDVVSWNYILTELKRVIQDLREGQQIHCEQGLYQAGFLEWQEALAQYAKSETLMDEAGYWEENLANVNPIFKPVEKERKNLELPIVEKRVLSLSLGDFTQANYTYHTKNHELVLSALVKGLSSYTDQQRLAVMLESYGRYDLSKDSELSQSVGWYTSLYPCVFSLENLKDDSYFIREVKEHYRRLPNLGIGYGLLKYKLHLLDKFPEPDIKINFLGDLSKESQNGQFLAENWLNDYDSSPFNKQSFALEITAYFLSGELHLIVKASQVFKNVKLEDLVDNLSQNLLNVVDHCGHSTELLSPSDIGAQTINLRDFDLIQDLHHDVAKILDPTPLQKGIFYQWLKAPKYEQYIEQSVFELHFPLNKKNMKRTINYLTSKYDVLRSNFVYEGLENVKQIIHDRSNYKADIRDLTVADEAELQELIEEDSNQQFDLANDPLFRIKLITVAQKRQVLVFTFHHLILDGWSNSLLIDEFIKIYQRGSIKTVSDFEDKAFEIYTGLVNQKNKKAALNYWTNYLKDYNSVCHFPIPTLATEKETKELEFVFEKKKTQALKILSQKYGVTVYTLLKAIWGLLLVFYTEDSDVVFGTVVSGRTKEIPNISTAVGMFINTIPVRVKTDLYMNFTDLIQAIKQESIRSEDYNFSSLADIQGQLSRKNKLFNTLFAFENYPIKQPQQKVIYDEKTNSRTEFDLETLCTLSDRLYFKLRYQTDKLDESAMNYLLESLETLLNQVIENPHLKLDEVSAISSHELRSIAAFSEDHDFYPSVLANRKEKNLIALIEGNAKDIPEQTAIDDYEKKYSYGEFVDESNLLAGDLCQEKVKPGDVVGLFMDKSADLVIAMYAVWKIGAVVLPIDIDFPVNRIDYMISNSMVHTVLTNFSADKLASVDCPVINIVSTPKEEKYEEINYIYQPNSLAYILYTSGSTGRPKGVEIKHASLTNFIFSSLKAVSLPDKINMIATTSCSFDISISEMFWPLVVGGSLTILNNMDAKNPDKICKAIELKHCNAIQTTPSRIQLLLQYEKNHLAFENLTHLYLMGEVLSESLVHEIRQVSPCEIFNCYGPTESTIWVSAKKVEPGKKITIGKPIENVQFYILRNNLTLAAIGTYGQLALAGDSLAAGYRDNEKLTSKSFVELGTPINQRVYLTGDLARWDSKGEVEVVGRVDNQIKINGVRIELDEIEKVASAHEGIKNAVALVNHDETSKFISLYFTSDWTTKKFSAPEIRQYLSHHLLSQMLPKQIYQVEYFPLNSNGKIDREKLIEISRLSQTQVQLIEEDVKYYTDTQRLLAKIWEKELNQKNIGLFESYFDIGGNSLKIIQLLNALNNELRVSLSIADLFKFPSIALLSERVDELSSHKFLKTKEITKMDISISEEDFIEQKIKVFVLYVLMISHLTKDPKVIVTECLADGHYTNYSFDTTYWETLEKALEEMAASLTTTDRLPSTNSASLWKYSGGDSILEQIDGILLEQHSDKICLSFDPKKIRENRVEAILNDLKRLLIYPELQLSLPSYTD